jgi:hypothetical protein
MSLANQRRTLVSVPPGSCGFILGNEVSSTEAHS